MSFAESSGNLVTHDTYVANVLNQYASVSGTAFSYDGRGGLTSDGARAFTFDVDNRPLTGAAPTAATFTCDPLGRMQTDAASSHKAFDGLNRDKTVTGLAAGYDANQNLTFDGARTFVYDGDNRLVSESAGGASTTLAYDPTGRLQTQATTAGGTTTTTTYLYDGDALAAEYNGSTLQERYAHGPGEDDPLVWYQGSTITAAGANYLIADRQGSVIGYSNGGAVAATYTYDPYGGPSAWGGSRFRYTGQIEIPELQLYDYKARFYDPVFGHFLQTDPVGYQSDVNLYAYVGDDPVDRADPTGLATTCNQTTCTTTADTYNQARSTGQTIVASPEVKAAGEAGKGQVAVKSGDAEKLGFIVKGADGKPVVQSANAKTADTDTGSTARATIPAGALAGIHGHIDSGENASNGMVDDPKSNGGYGDTQSLKAGIPMGTVSNGQVGWHEMQNGQLQFSYPKGAMNGQQTGQTQNNLNNEQKLFQTPGP
jgi:RHS repeat-associated protein